MTSALGVSDSCKTWSKQYGTKPQAVPTSNEQAAHRNVNLVKFMQASQL